MAHLIKGVIELPMKPSRGIPNRQRPRHFNNQTTVERGIGLALFRWVNVFGFDGVYQRGGFDDVDWQDNENRVHGKRYVI